MLRVQLAGNFEVRTGETPIRPLRSRRGEWLLALLCWYQGREVDREWLAANLWPESPEPQARANLRRTLTDLRDALGEHDCLHAAQSRTLSIDPARCECDLWEARSAVQSRQISETTLQSAAFDWLPGCYQEWVLPLRAEWHQLRDQILQIALEESRARDDRAGEIGILRIAIQAEPYREHYTAELMRRLAEDQDYAAAIQAYRHLRSKLRRDLSLEPGQAVQTLYRELSAQAKAPPEEPEAAIPSRRRTATLPELLGRTFGRESARNQLLQALHQNRLVTLVGPGGMGKTRLAVEVARTWQDRTATDRVRFLDLTPLSSPELVIPEVYRALDVADKAVEKAAEELIQRWGTDPVLLVLDNCEHLVEASAAAADHVLTILPGLRILATTRERLQLPTEWLQPLESLTEDPDAEAAVELFIDRAQRLRHGWIPSADQREVIRRICQRLDGLPLAIEIAAGQLEALSIDELAAEFEANLQTWVDQPGGAPGKHRSLQLMLEWSLRHLAADELAVLRTAAILVGQFRLEELNEIVVRTHSEAVPVARLVRDLVAKNLVVRTEEDGQSVFRLLETTRAVVRAHHSGPEEIQALRQAHADYYLDQAKEHLKEADTPAMLAGYLRTDDLYDNIREALGYVLHDRRDVHRALATHLTLFQYWSARTRIDEAWYWAQAILAAADPSSPQAGRVLLILALLAIYRDQRERAVEYAERGAAVAREIGDAKLQFLSALRLVTVYQEIGDLERAAGYAEGLEVAMVDQPPAVQTDTFMKLGILELHRGRHEAAVSYLQRSRRIANDHQWTRIAAWCDINEADCWKAYGKPLRALPGYVAGLQVMVTSQDRMGIFESARSLAEIETQLTTEPEAKAESVRRVASIQFHRGDLPLFTQLDQQLFDDWKSAAQTQIGEATFDAAWKQGAQDALMDTVYQIQSSAELRLVELGKIHGGDPARTPQDASAQ